MKTKQKVLLLAAAGLGYVYLKQKTCKGDMYEVKGEKVCEEDLEGYYMWHSTNLDYKSGYYHWSNFPSGFGVELDEAGFTQAMKDSVNLNELDPLRINAQTMLEKYWDGTEPIKFIK